MDGERKIETDRHTQYIFIYTHPHIVGSKQRAALRIPADSLCSSGLAPATLEWWEWECVERERERERKRWGGG